MAKHSSCMLSCRSCTDDSLVRCFLMQHVMSFDVMFQRHQKVNKAVLKVTVSFVFFATNAKASNCPRKWLHMRSEDGRVLALCSFLQCMYLFFLTKNAPFMVTKEVDVEKEASGLLEHPNGRPMAWKLNQLGSRGQRKWPQGQRTPPPDHRKGHARNVVIMAALVFPILSVKPVRSATP